MKYLILTILTIFLLSSCILRSGKTTDPDKIKSVSLTDAQRESPVMVDHKNTCIRLSRIILNEYRFLNHNMPRDHEWGSAVLMTTPRNRYFDSYDLARELIGLVRSNGYDVIDGPNKLVSNGQVSHSSLFDISGTTCRIVAVEPRHLFVAMDYYNNR